MDTKHITTMIVTLVVGVILVMGILVPIVMNASETPTTMENEGMGPIRFAAATGNYMISTENDGTDTYVVNGTDRQVITDVNGLIYADSNIGVYADWDAGEIRICGLTSDNTVISTTTDNNITIQRNQNGVDVYVGSNEPICHCNTPGWAYVPRSDGKFAYFENGTEIHVPNNTNVAYISETFAEMTAYNNHLADGGAGIYSVLDTDLSNNVLSSARWTFPDSVTSSTPDELNLVPLDLDPLDIDPLPLGPINPGNQLMAVPTPTYTDGDWGYDLDGDNNATIVSYSGSAGDITIPSTIGGYTVVAIGKGGTSQNVFDTSLSSYTVVISSGITTINKGAFNGCTGLTSVTIPEGVTSIGNNAFNGCTGLTSVTIPSTVTSIGNNAFIDSNIAHLLNLSDLEITGTSYGLNNPEIRQGDDAYLSALGYISAIEYVEMTKNTGAVYDTLIMIPILMVIALVMTAAAAFLTFRQR